MKYYRILILMLLCLSFLFTGCEKAGEEIESACMVLYDGANACDKPGTGIGAKIAELPPFKEIVCLNKDTPKEIVTETGTTSWYKVRIDPELTGWVETGTLLFQTEELPAVILKDRYLYNGDDHTQYSQLILTTGTQVTYLGYQIKATTSAGVESFKSKIRSIDGKDYWVWGYWVIVGAKAGVILKDSPLYMQPIDSPDYQLKQSGQVVTYKITDIAPVIGRDDKGWVTVALNDKSDRYYIFDEKKEAISYDEKDRSLAAFVKSNLNIAKKIVDEVNEAMAEENHKEKLDAMTDLPGKIKTLEESGKELSEYTTGEKSAKYAGTKVQGILKDFLTDVQSVTMVLKDLESRSSTTEEEVPLAEGEDLESFLQD